MKNNHYYRPLCIECISPDYFPSVALYIRSGGNFVLYKPHDRPFSDDDRTRLRRNFVEFLYVRTGDMEGITEYLENGLGDFIGRDDISAGAKGQILYQTTANYVRDIFEEPDKTFNLSRCRSMIKHLMRYVATSEDALLALGSLIGHNSYLLVHSVQVTALAMLFHEDVYQLPPHEMIDVGVGSLIHDLGMIFISNSILDSSDALSQIEYYKLKQHARKGYDYLQSSGAFSEIALSIVRHHHERYDGNGYPGMLRGDAIPRSAQVVAICDTYCSLTTERESRPATPKAQALKLMTTESPGCFNPELLARFVEIVSDRADTKEITLSPRRATGGASR